MTFSLDPQKGSLTELTSALQAIQGLEESAWTSLTINMSAMTSSGWTASAWSGCENPLETAWKPLGNRLDPLDFEARRKKSLRARSKNASKTSLVPTLGVSS